MKLTPKICLVVTGQTINQFLINLKLAQTQADLIELRVDFIQNLSSKHLELIKKLTFKTAILTCRSQDESGHFQDNEANRLNLIKTADSLGFDFIDLELKTLQNHPIKLEQTQLITSYHNFNTTPSLKKLKALLSQMDSSKPTIKKIATMVKSSQHLKLLFELLTTKKPDSNLIVIGMGETGKLARLFSPLLGGYLTYASFKDNKSALGQIDIKELKLFYQQLNNL